MGGGSKGKSKGGGKGPGKGAGKREPDLSSMLLAAQAAGGGAAGGAVGGVSGPTKTRNENQGMNSSMWRLCSKRIVKIQERHSENVAQTLLKEGNKDVNMEFYFANLGPGETLDEAHKKGK